MREVGRWLVWMDWCPAGLSVCLPLIPIIIAIPAPIIFSSLSEEMEQETQGSNRLIKELGKHQPKWCVCSRQDYIANAACINDSKWTMKLTGQQQSRLVHTWNASTTSPIHWWPATYNSKICQQTEAVLDSLCHIDTRLLCRWSITTDVPKTKHFSSASPAVGWLVGV